MTIIPDPTRLAAQTNAAHQAAQPEMCEICEKSDETVQRRHRNTMYQDDESNYMTSCQTCFDENWQHYQELWNDINSDIMASISDALSGR